jgi:putative transposase
MKRSKFSEEQVAYALRQAESGTPVGDVCRQLGVSEATFYARKEKYGHLCATELRRMRQLEDENMRLKRFGADLMLDKLFNLFLNGTPLGMRECRMSIRGIPRYGRPRPRRS